jgi:hypothetical protein
MARHGMARCCPGQCGDECHDHKRLDTQPQSRTKDLLQPIQWDTGHVGPRRSSLPTASPTSVIVEFHEFAGRWFVTGRWGQSSGIAVKRSVRKSALGKMVLDQAETARQGWRWRSAKALADEAELWERFCAGQAGVPMDRYLPEKRIVILVGQAGIRWHDASQSPPNWEHLPDRSARRLGGALIRRMNQLELSLPSAVSPAPAVPQEPCP